MYQWHMYKKWNIHNSEMKRLVPNLFFISKSLQNNDCFPHISYQQSIIVKTHYCSHQSLTELQ